jgi:apolipoprotein N-acyltransferase
MAILLIIDDIYLNDAYTYGENMIEKDCKLKFQQVSYLWLFIGFILLILSNGIHTIIPITTWLAPVFLIRFLRTQGKMKGLLTCVPLFLIAWIIMVYGLYYRMPVFVSIITGAIYGMFFFLPFLVDRLTNPETKSFWGTLIFPSAVVSIEYLLSLTPANSWFSLAYTQHDSLALIQLSSVTGIWGISFVIAWFASTVNWAWQQYFFLPNICKGISIYSSIVIAIFLLGGIYIVFFPADSETVRVAAITRSFDMDVEAKKCQKDVLCLKQLFERSLGEFLDDSKIAAEAGAKIIVWQENGLAAYHNDEAQYINKGREFAMQENVYLLMGMYMLSKERDVDENKAFLITPSGQESEYLKNHLTPGDNHTLGDGKVLIHNSKYGRLAALICQDTHTLSFVRQAGKGDADIMLIPNHNWESITPYVAIMANFRAIENGFSMVRVDYHGLSNAVDYHGKVLAQMNDFTTEERIMIADIPTQGIATLYAHIGDVFAWLCILALLIMIRLSFRPSKNV